MASYNVASSRYRFKIPKFRKHVENIMNIVPSFSMSDYANRLFSLEVKPSYTEAIVRQSSYIIKVSFSNLSQTIQSIHRLEGHVISVKMLSTALLSSFNMAAKEAESIVSPPTATASQTANSSRSNTRKSATPTDSQKGNTSGTSNKRGKPKTQN